MKLDRLFVWSLKLSGYLLISPVFFIIGLVRLTYYGKRLVRSIQAALICPNCREEIPLVGMWRCRCGYQYTGHLLRPCPVCGGVPMLARCLHCGVTRMI